jgi:5-methylcytosine-specific restriction protein A
MPANWNSLVRATKGLNKARYGTLTCAKCLKHTDKVEVDHIIPHSRQGTDEVTNLQCLCATCHKAKTLMDRFRK